MDGSEEYRWSETILENNAVVPEVVNSVTCENLNSANGINKVSIDMRGGKLYLTKTNWYTPVYDNGSKYYIYLPVKSPIKENDTFKGYAASINDCSLKKYITDGKTYFDSYARNSTVAYACWQSDLSKNYEGEGCYLNQEYQEMTWAKSSAAAEIKFTTQSLDYKDLSKEECGTCVVNFDKSGGTFADNNLARQKIQLSEGVWKFTYPQPTKEGKEFLGYATDDGLHKCNGTGSMAPIGKNQSSLQSSSSCLPNFMACWSNEKRELSSEDLFIDNNNDDNDNNNDNDTPYIDNNNNTPSIGNNNSNDSQIINPKTGTASIAIFSIFGLISLFLVIIYLKKV